MKLLGLGRISITTKIAASMSLLIIFIMLALGSVTIFQLNEALQRGEADKGRYLTGVLTSRLAVPLQMGDPTGVNRVVEDFGAQAGVTGVIVINAQKQPVAASGQAADGDHMATAVKKLQGTDFGVDYGTSGDGQRELYFLQGIKSAEDKVLGYVGVATGTGQLQARVNQLVVYLGTTAVAAVLAGIFLSIVISRRILNKPIHDLAAATESISTGDFSGKVELHQRDELGKLAMSFNIMTGYLANLFRSITSYTGELTKSCQALNTSIQSTDSANKRLVESLNEHVDKTSEQISLIEGCAKQADDFIQGVEQTGQGVRESAGAISKLVENAWEPGKLVTGAVEGVGEISGSLEKMKQATRSSKEYLQGMQKVTGLFSEYLDRSRTFNFKIAVEVAKAGGNDLTGELEELQKLTEEGLTRSREVFENLESVQKSLEHLEKACDGSISLADKSGHKLREVEKYLAGINEKLRIEQNTIDQIMNQLDENKIQGERLLETMDSILGELEKSVRAFQGSGEDGMRQAELLKQLDATLRRILRVSSTLNNLCLQFRT